VFQAAPWISPGERAMNQTVSLVEQGSAADAYEDEAVRLAAWDRE
jgi:hypothetical protein